MNRNIPGIKEMPGNAKFLGNGSRPKDWSKAAVWSPEPITVGDGVEIVREYEADGTAPAVTGGGLEDKNEKVAGWLKYELERDVSRQHYECSECGEKRVAVDKRECPACDCLMTAIAEA